jgi:protein gp37
MKDSLIEWTHHTFNPWIGCSKVSPGCQHCYAETLMDTRWQRVSWGKGNERQRTSESNWAQLNDKCGTAKFSH